MAHKPVFNEHTLLKALEIQGFTIEKSTDGWKVLAPDGVSTSEIHSSVIKGSGANRNYLNQMAQLQRAGFRYDLVTQPATAAGREQWKTERQEVEDMIAEQAAELKAKREAEDAKQSGDADAFAVIDKLGAAQRETYDVIASKPGLRPLEYADMLGIDRSLFSSHAQQLQRKGLIEGVGATRQRRLFLAKTAPGVMSTNGQPSASRVRTRTMEPGDRVVAFRKLAERAQKLRGDLDSTLGFMVDQFTAQEAELKTLRGKVKRFEDIFGRAVDAL